MPSDEIHWPFGDRFFDILWAVFALANLAAMAAFPVWETVPFHFIPARRTRIADS